MGIGRQLKVKATASSSDADLSMAWPTVTGGVTVPSSSQGTVQTSSEFGITTYMLTSSATVECSSDGSATVKSSVDNVVAHTGRLGVDCRPLVEIADLDGSAGIVGDALVDDFEVTPASASCTTMASPSTATATFNDDSDSERELSVTSSATGTVTVSVTCEADDYAPTTVEASYAISADVDSVGVKVNSGGECPKASSTPAGFDDAWACWMGIGRQLKVEVTASSSDLNLGIEWPDDGTTGGVLVPQDDEGTVQTSSEFGMTTHMLTSTATIECSSDGSATVESSVDSIVAHAGRLGVVCRPLVEIADLDDASKTRPRGETGKIAVTEEFTVTPSWASCSVAADSDSDAMLSFPDDSGTTRTVAASFTALSGMVTVEVTCSAESPARDYAPTTVKADLTLVAAVSVEDVSADATSGGECSTVDESVTLPEGVDDRWDCWMGKGRSLTVVVTATDTSDGMSLSWPADGRTSGLTLTSETEGDETFTERDGKHRRSTTAKFACTADGAARVVTTLDDEEAHVGLVNIDCRPLVTITGLHGNAASTQTIIDDFTVSPASATCRPVTSGLAATAIVTPSPLRDSTHRVTVTVTGTATGTVTVEVTCSATVGTQKYVPATATAEFVRFDDCTADLGVLSHGAVTRSGTIAADADCLSWKRGTSSAPNYARRYTLRVPAASRVSVDSTSADVDTYLYVLHGNGSAAAVLGSDNDSHTAGRTDSRVANVRVLPGLTYVVEVTSKPPRQTGPFTLTVTTTPDLPAVKIIGLDPVTRVRNGTRVLADSFTVEPATAQCTATAPAAVFTQTGGNRRVSQRMTGPAQATVVVTCSNDGNSDGTARAQFSLWQAVSSVTATALSGGSCTESTDSLPTGVDARYACEVSESVTLRVSAETRGAHATPLIGWSATADVTVTEASAGTPTAVDFATTPIVYTRTGTARVICTDDGTVMVTVTAGVDIYKVQLDITCGPHPAAHCVDDIGELGEGVTTRSGTIRADAACESLRRKPGDRRTWYARRHTFSLDAPATVTFVLEGVPAARPGVNVALLVLAGDNPGGTGARLHFNNNDSSNLAANRLNSRLANVALPKGTYTVEATTWHPWQTGRYTLTINAPAVRDTVAVTTLSGGSCEASEESPPAGIDDLWDCTVQPEGRLRVLATARSGATSFSHAWTVADGVTIPDEPDNPKILARQGPDELDTGWRQSSRIALECTTDGTADLTAGFGTGSGARTRKVRLDIDCNTPVQIKGLVDVTENGTTGETLTVSASFTVEPASAECTPTSTVGTATVTKPTGGDPDQRVVSMSLTVESSATVTVTCTATGRPDGVAKTTLRAHQPFTVTVSGDACATVPASVPRSYRCALSDEHNVTLAATADATVSDIALSWAATLGATTSSPHQSTATQLLGPDGAAAGWRRTGSVVASCTADGTVTLTAAAGTGTARVTRTAPVSIDCEDQGSISGFADAAGAGTGTVVVTDTFTVTPADAPCTVASTAGTATVDTVLGGAAADRIVSVSLAVVEGVDASAAVTVDCTPPGHAPVTARAAFAAAFGSPCDDPLGVLREGDVTRVGTITEDARCTSAQRGGVTGGWNQYARRHTFTLDRPANVQIWMNSSASNSDVLDTYVLLLYGHGTNGRVHSRNDNDSSRPRSTNSRLSRETLGPGSYTIEATTSLAGHTGIYDLRVNARLGAVITGLHGGTRLGAGTVTDTFTVDPPHLRCTTTAGTITPASGARRTLTVSLEAGETKTATVNCRTPLYPGASATATYEVLSACRAPAPGGAGAASGLRAARTTDGTCSENEPDVCSVDHKIKSPGQVRRRGTIDADPKCTSSQRDALEGFTAGQLTDLGLAGDLTYYARRHRITLPDDAWAVFELDADDSRYLRPYLVLTRGHADGGTGTVVKRAGGAGASTQIGPVFLRAGDYTVEATTAAAHQNGGYTLTAEITATGLATSYGGKVGQGTPIRFKYWPADAQIAIRAAANEELQPTITTTRTTTNRNTYGIATITLSPQLAHTHQDTDDPDTPDTGITIRVRSASSSRLLGGITLSVDCPSGETASINNGVLCISTDVNQGNPLARAKYRVTPGTLNGILASAEAAKEERPNCGITVNQLAAFMLSIGYHEVGSGRAGRAAPSPMILGRKDTFERRDDRTNQFNYVNDTVLGEPRRAFFHPGVGWWQLDDNGWDVWVKLNHGQRAHTGTGPVDGDGDDVDFGDTGGEVMANEVARVFCSAGLTGVKSFMFQNWYACKPSKCADTYDGDDAIYLSDADDLHVTIARNHGQYSADGGVSDHHCRWVDSAAAQDGLDGALSADAFDCFWYDTTRPEGGADLANLWSYPARISEDKSPLAAPFVAFTHDAKRFAVFPGPVMTALKPADHSVSGAFETWVKRVPRETSVRAAGKGFWSTGGLNRATTPEDDAGDQGDDADDDSADLVLQVMVCDEPEWVVANAAGGACRWFGVNGVKFASRMGFSGTPQPGGVL